MFSFLVSASLRCRILVLAIAAIIIAYGVFTQRSMPIDVFPNLNKGIITIMTEVPGLAPEEVELLVTRPIEAAVAGAMGMTRIRSASKLNLSIVYVEFDWGVDILRARQLVSERLQVARAQLPDDAQPILMPTASLMGEVLILAMTGLPGDPMALRELADWVVAPRLRAVPGVSNVQPIGGEVRQYRVAPDLLRMNQMGITIQELERALLNFGSNHGGGVSDKTAQEFQIRILGRTTVLEDLRNVSIVQRFGQPVLLHQIADVSFQAKQRRGDASYMLQPAVLMSIQKQPGADTLDLTARLEAAVAALGVSMPPGVKLDQIVFRQADFIDASIGNVKQVLIEAMAAVAVVLFLFLANTRTTAISLVAIPLSVLMTFIVFRWMGLTLNTMTLGGLAIAIGELVDDAVVDVENIYRRLSENRRLAIPRPALEVIADASQEVRSGIVQSTLIIIIVFIPVFAIPGIEGLFFAPLGIAYIVSIFSSLIVSITLTPVLCYYLLPRMRQMHNPTHRDSWVVRQLKQLNLRLLQGMLNNPAPFLVGICIACFLAVAIIPTLPRAFLPRFNEGSVMIEMTLEPGISLEESSRIGRVAEKLLLAIPEVKAVGRRTGRSEYDELAQGVHMSEIETRVEVTDRTIPEVMDEIRTRLSSLPGSYNVGQPIGHRLIDHVLTGAAAQVVIKVFGDDLDVLRNVAGTIQAQLGSVPGLVDLRTERQVPVPQIQIHVDPQKALNYGIQSGPLSETLSGLIHGREVSEIFVGERHFEVIVRLDDAQRDLRSLSTLLVETGNGPVPLSHLANTSETSGPNEILRENNRRRLNVLANGSGANQRLAQDIRAALADIPLPVGYFVSFEGIYAEQDQSSLRLMGLAFLSLGLIFAMLYTRYRSLPLVLIVMCNVPLALIGCVVAMKITGLELSVASMVGFITLAGISTRNGILKINHFINLVLHEGEKFNRQMIVRGSQERLVPVLTTAVSACIGLVPLLLDPSAPGKEILHPVAVVIFGGLVSATILDSMLTPYLFHRFGQQSLQTLVQTTLRGSAAKAFD